MDSTELRNALFVANSSNNVYFRLESKIDALADFILGRQEATPEPGSAELTDEDFDLDEFTELCFDFEALQLRVAQLEDRLGPEAQLLFDAAAVEQILLGGGHEMSLSSAQATQGQAAVETPAEQPLAAPGEDSTQETNVSPQQPAAAPRTRTRSAAKPKEAA
jgi:hypothetical protein